MPNIIDILINANWRGSSAVNRAQADMRKLGNQATATSGELSTIGDVAPATGKSLAGLGTALFAATAAFAAVTIAAKKGYEAIKAGAELEATQIRFDRLAESIGTTGQALSDDLGSAIRGLASDTEAMALATDLMALGLATSHEEAVRLASVAAQLGFDMNQLVLTLTNQTTLRFDQLGVAVAGFEAKVNRLEAAGHNADEAFKLAFIEQAEEQIDRVGSRIETTAGKMDVIGSAWKNTTDEMKAGATAAFEPIISYLADMIIAANDAETAVRQLDSAFDDLGKQEAVVRAVNEAIEEMGSFLGAPGSPLDFSGATIKTRDALIDLTAELIKGSESQQESEQVLESFGFEVDKFGVKLNGLGVSWIEVNKAVKQALFADELEAFQQSVRRFTFDTEGQAKAAQEAADAAKEWEEQQAKINKRLEEIELDELLDKLDVSEQTWLKLILAQGGEAQALEYLQKVMKDTGQATDDLTISAKELADAQELAEQKLRDRADLWLDFQTDLTDISVRAGEMRMEAEERFESQRTEIVERYGQQRAREEEDFQRNRARAEEAHRRSIDKVRQDSQDRQLELRADANRRLADLEQNHLERMREIIENADLQLAEAASRLDARAVASIERSREDALQDEQDSYKKQRKEIQEELARRLKEEQEQAKKRIAEMEEFFAERKRIEDEDRRIRLDRLKREHEERLDELDRQKTQRLNQIKQEANEERNLREQQYRDERLRLEGHWSQRGQIEQQWMNTILAREQEFWRQRGELIGGGDISGVGGVGGGTGGGTDTGGSEQKPTRTWLENMVMQIANPPNNEAAFAWLQWIKQQTDATLAKWIETHSDIDVPGYQRGTAYAQGGLALVGEGGPELVRLPRGSQVLNNSLTRQFFSRAGGATIGEITINVNEATRPGDTALEVRREMEQIFRELAQ